jgi:dynein heavy chain
MDKDVYIRKYAKANRSPSQFDVDITKYKQQQTEIIAETSNHVINFVRVDCNVMKDSMGGHCLQFQNRLATLLHENSLSELKDIMNLFKNSSDELVKLPKDLDELSSKISLRRKLSDSLEDVHLRFDPLREMYDTLIKFDVAIPEEELGDLGNINDSFSEHKIMLTAAEKTLEKSKVGMKRNLEEQMEEYSQQVTEIRETSKQDLPFKADISLENAFASIENYKQQIVKMKTEEARLGKGLVIFSTNITEHADLTALQKDIGFLEQIWSITQEWRGNECTPPAACCCRRIQRDTAPRSHHRETRPRSP